MSTMTSSRWLGVPADANAQMIPNRWRKEGRTLLEDNINRLRALVDERQLKHLVRTYNFKAQFFHPHALSLHYRFTSSMQYSTTGSRSETETWAIGSTPSSSSKHDFACPIDDRAKPSLNAHGITSPGGRSKASS